MTASVQRFISELIRAANEIDKLTMIERATLLRRAAATIRDLRDEINYFDTPANDTGPGDVVFDLNETARMIEIFEADAIGQELLSAVGTIKAALVLLDAKREIEQED